MAAESNEEQRLYAGRVLLEAATGAGDGQDICPAGYHVVVKRLDGAPMSEMELRTLITNLSWAIDGEVCHIDLERV
jgi:hypothetical protein